MVLKTIQFRIVDQYAAAYPTIIQKHPSRKTKVMVEREYGDGANVTGGNFKVVDSDDGWMSKGTKIRTITTLRRNWRRSRCVHYELHEKRRRENEENHALHFSIPWKSSAYLGWCEAASSWEIHTMHLFYLQYELACKSGIAVAVSILSTWIIYSSSYRFNISLYTIWTWTLYRYFIGREDQSRTRKSWLISIQQIRVNELLMLTTIAIGNFQPSWKTTIKSFRDYNGWLSCASYSSRVAK